MAFSKLFVLMTNYYLKATATISPPPYPLTPAKIFERSQKVKVRPKKSSYSLESKKMFILTRPIYFRTYQDNFRPIKH